MKKIILILMMACSLSGCLATALVSTAAIGGSILFDKRSMSTIMDDSHTTQTAQNLLYEDKYLRGRSHIRVTTFNHVTLLVGQAQTQELKQRAAQLVSMAPGIKRLYNEINVSGATSAIQRTNDSWLSAKVRSALLTNAGFKSSQLSIMTENSVVYLMGEVSHTLGNKAANIARRVTGVTKVVKVFQYTK